MWRNFTLTVVLMAFTFLVVIPSSEGYDFLGEPNHKKATKTVKEETKEEVSVEDQQADAEVVPEQNTETEDITVREEKLDYYEIEYSKLLNGNAMEKLPKSKTGNYVVIYRSQTCPYCDQLIAELKGKIGDYTLIVVKCSGTVQDVFFSRWVYQYPAFLVIKGKQVRYYGYGYRPLGEFKRLL